MSGIPDTDGAFDGGVIVNAYAIRLELPAGMTRAEYVAANQLPQSTFATFPVDDWAREYWWLDKPAGESS